MTRPLALALLMVAAFPAASAPPPIPPRDAEPPAFAGMVAAHNADLDAARACGLRTAFVARPTEGDDHPGAGVDLTAGDFRQLAALLGT